MFMNKAQFYFDTRMKLRVLALIFLVVGGLLFMDMFPIALPIDNSAVLFELFGFQFTVPLLLLTIGIVLILFSFIIPYGW